MAIPATAVIGKVTYNFGALGEWTHEVVDDGPGTLRVITKFNGATVMDTTPAGGHVEIRMADPLPANVEVS